MAVALDVEEAVHLDRPRLADAPEVVAPEVDEHEVLGALLLVGEEVLLEADVLLGVRAAPARARDRVRRRHAVPHRHERLGAGPDDLERPASGVGETQQVHVRAGVGRPQDPVDVERLGGRLGLEPLADHDLERVARADPLLGGLDRREVAVAVERAGGPAGERPASGSYCATVDGAGAPSSAVIRSSRASASSYAASARSGLSSQFTALAMRVTVPSWWSSAARSVASSMTSSGICEVVLGVLGEALEAADRVVPDVADEPAGERGQAGQRVGAQPLQGLAQRDQRVGLVVVPGAGQADRRGARPVRPAAALGQRRRAARPDEREARPRLAVRRRLEQERPAAAPGELAVDPQRASRRRPAGGGPPG